MSGENIAYHLRLKKNIERQIFIDLLTQIMPYTDIKKYSYISMGGAYLEDHKLIHSFFNIQKLYSIEQSPTVIKRQNFNKFISTLRLLQYRTKEMIEDYPIIKDGTERNKEIDFSNEKIIFWLDYTSTSELGNQFAEFRSILQKASEGSIIKITVNAHAPSLGTIDRDSTNKTNDAIYQEEIQKNRLNKLQRIIGNFFLADKCTIQRMTSHKYPFMLFDILQSIAFSAFSSQEDCSFLPLSSSIYSDGQTMLTYTGIIIKRKDKKYFFEKTSLKKWEHSLLKNKQPTIIDVPSMSLNEKLHIDSFLPSNFTKLHKRVKFKFEEDDTKNKNILKNYAKYYRYYPNYFKIIY